MRRPLQWLMFGLGLLAALGAHGQVIYITEVSPSSRVVAYDLATRQPVDVGTALTGGLYVPSGHLQSIATDPAGNVYLAVPYFIYKYDSTGAAVTSFGTNGSVYTGFNTLIGGGAVNPAGTQLVLPFNANTNAVYAYNTSDGSVAAGFTAATVTNGSPPTNPSSPWAVAFNPSGTFFYVTSPSGALGGTTLTRFSPTGGTGTIITPLTFPAGTGGFGGMQGLLFQTDTTFITVDANWGYLSRYVINGTTATLDTTFGSGGYVSGLNGVTGGLAADSSGNLYVFVNGSTNSYVMQFDANGALLDSAFLTLPGNNTYGGHLAIGTTSPAPGGEPVTPTLTWSQPAAITYGTALSATQLNATASVGSTAVPGTFTYAPAAGTVLDAGAGQTLGVTFTPDDTLHYTTATATQSITVNKADQAITFPTIADKTYGDAPFSISASASSGLPVTFSVVSGPATLNGNAVTLTGAGAVTLRASQAGNGNFNAAPDVERSFQVAKAAATVTLGGLSATYDGAAHSATTTTTPSGLLVTVTYDGGATAPTNVGSYAVVATVNDANYHGSANGTLVIAKAALTAKADDKFKVQGKANPPLTISYSGFVNGETKSVLAVEPTISTTATTSSAAGTYPITLSGGSAANYALTLQAGVMTVDPQPTVTEPLLVSTIAGLAGTAGTTDGTGSAVRFNSLVGVAADTSGNFYIADTSNHTLRKVTSTGVVTTLAGQAGTSGSADGTGTAATFKFPSGLALDSAGNLYVADTGNHTVRKVVVATGVVTTLAGLGGTSGSADGTGTAARFYGPEDVALDGTGTLYVADTINDTVRKLIISTGAVTTVAGQAGVTGSANGTGAAATFNAPSGIIVGAGSTLYVADSGNNAIRKIDATGTVTTLAGQAGSVGAADGTGTAARFNDPSALAADGSGATLYVLDTGNHTVRKVVTTTGVVTTLAGQAGTAGTADGVGDAAQFSSPSGLAWFSTGVGIADTGNHTVRLGQFLAAVAITAQPQSQTVTAGTNVTFSVTATGQPAPTYQWRKDGTAIAGATSSSYSITSAQSSHAGNYTVVVSNVMGSATSNAATLTVNVATPPPSDGGGSGGGGAPSVWFSLALVPLSLTRVIVGRRRKG